MLYFYLNSHVNMLCPKITYYSPLLSNGRTSRLCEPASVCFQYNLFQFHTTYLFQRLPEIIIITTTWRYSTHITQKSNWCDWWMSRPQKSQIFHQKQEIVCTLLQYFEQCIQNTCVFTLICLFNVRGCKRKIMKDISCYHFPINFYIQRQRAQKRQIPSKT